MATAFGCADGMNVKDKSPAVLKRSEGSWVKDSSGVMRWVKRTKPAPKLDRHDPRGMPWCSCTPLLSTITRQKEVQNG